MRAKAQASLCAAGMLAFGLSAFAQGAGQPPAQPQTQPGARSAADQEITVTGCIQKEADWRKAHDEGRGGVAGTGVGAGNEFVLTEASTKTPAAAGEATGTAGAIAAYELTGPNEGQVSQYVGRRVEIVGKLKAAEIGAGGKPTGGATAGAPPSGVDAMSKDLKLRELEVTSVRESTGTCKPIK